MKIIIISDTHGKHDLLYDKFLKDIEEKFLDEETMLIHAGDVTKLGHNIELLDFLDWYQNLRFTYKIFIAGNHDFMLEMKYNTIDYYYIIREQIKKRNIYYLESETINIDGIKIYGSPYTPEFRNWSFMYNRQLGELIWADIEKDTDIIVSHGPAYNILDKATKGDNTGCKDLYNKILEIKPKLHICGHIHEARGTFKNENTLFVNASNLTHRYTVENEPLILNYNDLNG